MRKIFSVNLSRLSIITSGFVTEFAGLTSKDYKVIVNLDRVTESQDFCLWATKFNMIFFSLPCKDSCETDRDE